jgi:GNAT superfamily N-acetyltransferase
MAEVTIRLATDADRDAAIDLIQELNVFENGLSGDRLEDRAAAEAHHAALAAMLAKAGGELLLAERAGQVVGLAAWAPRTDDVYVVPRYRRFAVVEELIVAAAHRRLGIATLLLAEIERRARAENLPRLVVGVIEGNRGAEAAYARFGFRPYTVRLMKPLD